MRNGRRHSPDDIVFRYRAAEASGRIVTGRINAVSEPAALVELDRRSLYPLDLQAAPARRALRVHRVSKTDLSAIFQNLAALTAAGVPLERAIGASEPLADPRLRACLRDVRRRMREGEGVASALSAHPQVFSAVLVGTIAAGERGSRLSQALEQVSAGLEREARLSAEIRSALAYPLLIAALGAISIVVMGGVVVPRFSAVLADLGVDLPRSTRVLLALSSAFQRFGWLAALTLGAAGVGARLALLDREIRGRAHALLLKTPGLGRIRHGFSSARVCSALGGMLNAGMPLLAALDASAAAAGDEEVHRRLTRTQSALARGERLTTALELESALSPIALQLIAVGETTGDLARLASQAGELAADRAQRQLQLLTKLLEPAMVIAIGLLVALIASALLQAMYSVRPGV